jgi:hypothetical protein
MMDVLVGFVRKGNELKGKREAVSDTDPGACFSERSA